MTVEDEDEELIRISLDRMKDVVDTNRGAQLRLSIALMIPNGELFTAEEKVGGYFRARRQRADGKGFRTAPFYFYRKLKNIIITTN